MDNRRFKICPALLSIAAALLLAASFSD